MKKSSKAIASAFEFLLLYSKEGAFDVSRYENDLIPYFQPVGNILLAGNKIFIATIKPIKPVLITLIKIN